MSGKKAFSSHVACVHQTFMDLTCCNVHSTAHFLLYQVREVANKQLSRDVQLIGGFNPSYSSGFCTERHCLSLLATVLPLMDTCPLLVLIPQKLSSQSSHFSL